MIKKLQKFFHTEKWWGKMFFIFLFYLFFSFIFYGIWIIVSFSFGEYEYSAYRTLIYFISIILHFILPVVTFFVFPRILKKIMRIKHPYVINSIAIFLILVLFIFFEIIISLKNFFGQMFI